MVATHGGGVGVGLAAFTVYEAATGKKVDPTVLVSSVLTIVAFLRDN
jgi:hypothetical protein